MNTLDAQTPDISVVIPVFNEAKNLRPLAARLRRRGDVLRRLLRGDLRRRRLGRRQPSTLRALCAAEPRFRALSFVAQFRQGDRHRRRARPCARHAPSSSWTPTSSIRRKSSAHFIEKWREGYKNIYGQRVGPRDRSQNADVLHQLFYRLLENFGDVSLPPGAGDFRLLDRQAVDALSDDARARALQQGTLRLDRLQVDRRALRRRKPRKRRIEVQLTAGWCASRSTG